jgi:hypothetical protein
LPDVAARHELLGFGPACETAVVLRALPMVPGERAIPFSLVALDTATGKVLATLVEKMGTAEIIGKSRDGRMLVLCNDNRTGGLISLLDTSARTNEALPLSSDAVNQFWQDALSPDGRFAALYAPPNGFFKRDPKTGGLILWDTAGKRQRAFLPGLNPPYEFSADGRSLAVSIESEKASRLGILNLETLKVRETGISASTAPFDRGCLNDDGSYLGRFILNSTGVPFEAGEVELVCSNIATGAVVTRESLGKSQMNRATYGRVAFAGDGRYLVFFPTSRGSQNVRCFDLASGNAVSDRFPQDGVAADISPDGRFVLTMKESPAPLPWRRIIRALHLSWRVGKEENQYAEVFDAATGRSCGYVPGKGPAFSVMNRSCASADVGWAPDGRSLAVQDKVDPNMWYIWDIPPRKPLRRFALASAILALPLAGLAWRRSRRLRRGAA